MCFDQPDNCVLVQLALFFLFWLRDFFCILQWPITLSEILLQNSAQNVPESMDMVFSEGYRHFRV